MRMWMINPKILCRKHLWGEHGELHKFRHNFVKKHRMDGRVGQIEPNMMGTRHNELAQEMLDRGYRHESPYTDPAISYLDDVYFPRINKMQSAWALFERCEECRLRYVQRLIMQDFLTRLLN